MSFDELADGQGELAISMEYNSTSQHLSIEAYVPLPQDTKPQDVAAAYLSLCDSNSPALSTYFVSDSHTQLDLASPQLRPCTPAYTILDARPPLAIFAGKKYKPVALKVRPVETELPSRFRIVRNIQGDPLQDLPQLPTHPLPYKPTGRYTEERKDVIDRAHPGDFLLPAERALMHSFMSIQNAAFAWCDPERDNAPQARQHMRICAEGRLRAQSPTQRSAGPTGWWRGEVRGSATSATHPIQHPTHSDRSPPPTARIGPKLGRNIEHWWYDGSPANRSAAIPRSLAISQDIY